MERGLSAEDAIDAIGGKLRPHGLMVRGVTRHGKETVLLVGHAGANYWPHFQLWLARQPIPPADPLDAWSRTIVEGVARDCGARGVFPSDRPYWPFQRWAMRAEGLKPSPLGILMHPDYGLWHAYRGALIFNGENESTRVDTQQPVHLCDTCIGKPCLNACPVSAYGGDGFDRETCRAHVGSEAGRACRSGCLDRNACPYGAAYRYPAEVQAFHQRAFLASP